MFDEMLLRPPTIQQEYDSRSKHPFVDKLLDLKRAWMQNPNSLNELRYNLALERYGRLQKDTVDLTRLEQKIVQINNESELLRTESA